MFWLSCLCPGWPVPTVLTRLPYLSVPSCAGSTVQVGLSQLFSPCCYVLAILSSLPCPGWPVPTELSSWPIQTDLFQFSCPSCSGLAVMPRLSVMAVLPRWSCLVVLSQLSCPAIFWPPCPDWSIKLPCPDWPVPTVLSICIVPAVLSRLSCRGRPVPVATSQLSCLVMFWPSCYLFPSIVVLSWLSSPAVLYQLSC